MKDYYAAKIADALYSIAGALAWVGLTILVAGTCVATGG